MGEILELVKLSQRDKPNVEVNNLIEIVVNDIVKQARNGSHSLKWSPPRQYSKDYKIVYETLRKEGFNVSLTRLFMQGEHGKVLQVPQLLIEW